MIGSAGIPLLGRQTMNLALKSSKYMGWQLPVTKRVKQNAQTRRILEDSKLGPAEARNDL